MTPQTAALRSLVFEGDSFNPLTLAGGFSPNEDLWKMMFEN